MKKIGSVGFYFASLCPAFEVLLLSLVQMTVSFDEALIPPQFPDIFSSFAESLSASDSLRLFVHSLVDDDNLCGCHDTGKVNWTQFNANLGLFAFSDVAQRCALMTNGNGREPNNAAISGGQTGQTKPLVIGLSVAVVVVVVIIICFLAFKKGLCSCMVWDVVRKKSLNLERQRNNCPPVLQPKSQTVVSVSDSVTCSDTNMVSDVGCFGFSKKLKTRLPMKNQEYKNSSKSQNIALRCYPIHSDNAELADGSGKNSSEILSDEQFLSVSKYLGLSQTDVHLDSETPTIDSKGEKTDSCNFHFESSDSKVKSDAAEKQKAVQPLVLSTASAGNVAWSMLPNGRQFIGNKENLVDHNNIHLFMNCP